MSKGNMDYDLTDYLGTMLTPREEAIATAAIKKLLEWLAKPFENPCPCRTYDRQVCDSPADRLVKACPDYALWYGQQQGYAKAMQERGKHEMVG